MFKRPEELIMAIFALLWVGLAYFVAGWATAASVKYTWWITGLNLVWVVVAFLLWQADRIRLIYPILLGALVLCWTPWLDWFMVRHVVPAADGSVLLPARPWYATWTFKLVLTILPIIGGYVWQWRRHRQRQWRGLK